MVRQEEHAGYFQPEVDDPLDEPGHRALRARDHGREQELQLRAAEWFEATGEIRRATRHFFAARQPDRALTLLQDRVVADFLLDPALPPPPDLRRYLTGQAAQLRPDPFTEQLITAALQERTAQPQPSRSRGMPAEPLTAAEMRILKLLPASTYPQIASTLFISRNTVKTHIRSIYQKLGVTGRLEAIERALELRLL